MYAGMINNSAVNKSWTAMIPVFIIVAAFGPYVFSSYGLRTEHLLLYPLLLFAIPVFIMRQRFMQWSRPLLGILVLLLGVTLWTLAVSISGDHPTVSSYKYISSIENYIQPAAIIIVVLAFVRYTLYTDFLCFFQRLCRYLILLLCLNSIIACCSIFFDLSNFIRLFTFSCFGDLSVSQLASTMGRHSGIFNQPMEAGLTYSLGLLSWGYLKRVSAKTGFTDYLTLFALIVGGALSVSKVFILGGIPLFVLYWNPVRTFKKHLNFRFVLAAIIGCCVILWMVQFWAGWGYFVRLFEITGETNLVVLYTGGRFGIEGISMVDTFARIWQEAPLQGFGFGAVSCFDNGYLEFFLQGGLVALLGYLTLLVIFFWQGFYGLLNGYEEGRLLLAYFVLVMGGSLGAPVITINRFSTIFWVLTTFLFLMLQVRRRDKVKNRIISNQTLMNSQKVPKMSCRTPYPVRGRPDPASRTY